MVRNRPGIAYQRLDRKTDSGEADTEVQIPAAVHTSQVSNQGRAQLSGLKAKDSGDASKAGTVSHSAAWTGQWCSGDGAW